MSADSHLTRASLQQVLPMLQPKPMAALPTRLWTAEQWQRLRGGYRAQDMDEKWDVFTEGHTVFCHRSWTGYGIYAALFEQVPGGYRIESAQVEGDPDRYGQRSDEFDAVMLELVLASIVLGEPALELRARLVELIRQRSGKPDVPSGLIQHSVLGLRTDQ